MNAISHPTLAPLFCRLRLTDRLGEIWIREVPTGFELRHRHDKDRPRCDLEPVGLAGLRSLAQATAAGAFRPLKAAPTLQDGWICRLTHPRDLWTALNMIYPGTVGDWYAARNHPPPITSYRALAARQTGIYRKTKQLDPGGVRRIADSCCQNKRCLKQPLWLIQGVQGDPEAAKTEIPCLEPCAVFLEIARRAVEGQRNSGDHHNLTRSEVDRFIRQLDAAASAGDRPGVISSPSTLDRRQLET